MDNFKAVYKILTTLEQEMDSAKLDLSAASADALCVSNERWAKYIEMMYDVGYIKGVTIKRDICGDAVVDTTNMRITLKGLEYLQENSIMRRIYNVARGIAEII